MGEKESILREYFSQLGKKGAKSRASRYSHEQLSKWAKLGGRPPKSASTTPQSTKKDRQQIGGCQ